MLRNPPSSAAIGAKRKPPSDGNPRAANDVPLRTVSKPAAAFRVSYSWETRNGTMKDLRYAQLFFQSDRASRGNSSRGAR